jgi:hypothetical protein
MFPAIKLFFTLLLIFTAYLQLNDPDPLFWASLYLLCASIPLLSLFKNNHKPLSVLAGISAVICLGALLTTYQGMLDYLLLHIADESLVNDMSPDKPYIEEGREFIGTLWALCVVLTSWYFSHKKYKRIESTLL